MNLPIGYHKFHKDKFINYQLNRWFSLGYARIEDIQEIGKRINSFDDYINEFSKASSLAKSEKRLKNAAVYLRASEFLIPPDSTTKLSVYNDFISLFDTAFKGESYGRHKVPYQNSFLSAIRFPSKNEVYRGTIIGCGGFDSFIEEFYCIWSFFAENGFDVIAFEGPGQGGSRRLHNLTFDHDWEKPTSAVLDYFMLNEVTAIGISMGGYWILRAAAFEKRIKNVIAMPPVYDWLELTNSFNIQLVNWLLKKRDLMNFLIRLKINIGTLKHTINNALFIQNKNEPIDAVKWMLNMNKEHICSHLINQDVLLLTGENDAFQPPILLEKQYKSLTNSGSVTKRIFKKSEHADQHCQIGNMGLALETMLKWINERHPALNKDRRF